MASASSLFAVPVVWKTAMPRTLPRMYQLSLPLRAISESGICVEASMITTMSSSVKSGPCPALHRLKTDRAQKTPHRLFGQVQPLAESRERMQRRGCHHGLPRGRRSRRTGRQPDHIRIFSDRKRAHFFMQQTRFARLRLGSVSSAANPPPPEQGCPCQICSRPARFPQSQPIAAAPNRDGEEFGPGRIPRRRG